MIRYLSVRDLSLVYQGEPRSVPVLTVENYCKWYTLYAVHPDGSVHEVDMIFGRYAREIANVTWEYEKF